MRCAQDINDNEYDTIYHNISPNSFSVLTVLLHMMFTTHIYLIETIIRSSNTRDGKPKEMT